MYQKRCIPLRFSTIPFLMGLCLSGVWAGNIRAQGYNSVIITEIMADPTPVVGLPNAEYIEIFNRSPQPISTKGWRLGTTLLPDSVLAPGGYAILCSRNSVPLLTRFGRVWGLSSFSLANAGATLTLRNAKGTLVFSITYKDTWWPSNRRNGGYALEMVDTASPCGETENWRVSTDPLGGTPNKPNSVTAPNPDRNPPVAERVEISGENQLTIYYNERLDSLASSQSGTYELKGRSIRRSVIEAPGFRTSLITLDAPLLAGQRYELVVGNLTDCVGNALKPTTFVFGLPVVADSGDVVLNEILFDPRTGGVEFAEIYNRSPNFISLKNWSLGNVRVGVPGSFRTVATGDLLLAPNEFIAFSVNSTILAEQYPTERPRTLITIPSMPSFVNEIGGVALRDATGRLVDIFEYKDNDQSPLITNAKGVSLERIYPERAGNDPQNWQSAAAVVGYATPGYANSQGTAKTTADGFVVEPEAITPNDDGVDDYATIRYSLTGSGRVASVRIFDTQGRLVRDLVRNQTIGTDGSLRWEGQNDRGEIVRTGYYLVLIDSFDSAGNTQQFKKKVVVVQP